MTKYEGKCPQCGKFYHSDRKDDMVLCDCWRYCPLCGAEMAQYTPDLVPGVYGIDAKREFAILMVCTNHSSPFFSTQKPIEVVCT